MPSTGCTLVCHTFPAILGYYCIGGATKLLQLALKKRKIAAHFCFLIKPSIFYVPFESDTA